MRKLVSSGVSENANAGPSTLQAQVLPPLPVLPDFVCRGQPCCAQYLTPSKSGMSLSAFILWLPARLAGGVPTPILQVRKPRPLIQKVGHAQGIEIIDRVQ